MVKQTLLSSFFQKQGNAESRNLAPTSNGDEDPTGQRSMPVTNDDSNPSNTIPHVDTEEDDTMVISDEEHPSPSAKEEHQQIQIEHKEESDKVGTIDTSTDAANNHLSEYEKLRLRNIKRNHERLVALGLVDPSVDPTSSESKDRPPRQTKRRKRAVPVNAATSNVPVRRSTRNSGTSALLETKEDGILRDGEIMNESFQQIAEEEEEEQFEDSPLVQYTMESSARSKSSCHEYAGAISSLVPMGPRLIPPKANLAIYSLDISASSRDAPLEWIVGAGKSGIVSIWNYSNQAASEDGLDPVISWKSHGGRWVADARFIPSQGDLNSSDANVGSSLPCPSNLLTAANDGCVCLWDVRSLSCQTGAPKNLATTGKNLHKGGIFSMHVNLDGSNYADIHVCTGSKDKTLAVTTLESISRGAACRPIFVSHHHGSKVGCVQLQGRGSSLVGSASDDGSVAVHDFRSEKVVADIDYAHAKPHSVVWHPRNENLFITAGHDESIYTWDLRSLKEPVRSYHGHVPLTTKKCKSIHRPCFLTSPSCDEDNFILSGSENSGCLSIFQCNSNLQVELDVPTKKKTHIPVYSRGLLPNDCGDVGCIAVHGSNAAVAVDGGEVLLLEPRSRVELA